MRAVARTTSPIKAVCITRSFCTRKNSALPPDDDGIAGRVPSNDGRRFARGVILPTVFGDIIHAVFNPLIYLVEKLRGRFTRNIGRGGNEGFAESFDQVAAEGVIDEPDSDGALGIDEIGRQAQRAFINDGGRFGYGAEIVEDAQIGLAGIA